MARHRTINFVNIKTVWTPAREEDYATLRSLGVPMTWVGLDHQQQLSQLCAKHNVSLEHENFSDVEKALISRIKERWNHEFSTLNKDLVFSFATNSVAAHKQWDGLLAALLPWYSRYHIRLEQQTRTRKRGTLTTHTLTRHFASYLVF